MRAGTCGPVRVQISASIRPFLQETASPGIRVRASRAIRALVFGGIAVDRVAVKRLVALLLPKDSAGTAAPSPKKGQRATPAGPSGLGSGWPVVEQLEYGLLFAHRAVVQVNTEHGAAACMLRRLFTHHGDAVRCLLQVWLAQLAELALLYASANLCAAAADGSPAPPAGGLARRLAPETVTAIVTAVQVRWLACTA